MRSFGCDTVTDWSVFRAFPLAEELQALTTPYTTGFLASRLKSNNEVNFGHADDTGVLHRNLEVHATHPSASLCHIRHIEKDDDIIRVVRLPVDTRIREPSASLA
jgi:hypothetical protein